MHSAYINTYLFISYTKEVLHIDNKIRYQYKVILMNTLYEDSQNYRHHACL